MPRAADCSTLRRLGFLVLRQNRRRENATFLRCGLGASQHFAGDRRGRFAAVARRRRFSHNEAPFDFLSDFSSKEPRTGRAGSRQTSSLTRARVWAAATAYFPTDASASGLSFLRGRMHPRCAYQHRNRRRSLHSGAAIVRRSRSDRRACVRERTGAYKGRMLLHRMWNLVLCMF